MTTWLSRAIAVVLLAVVAVGCGSQTAGSSPSLPSAFRSTNVLPTGHPTRGPTLTQLQTTPSEVPSGPPPGFPVMPGAETARLPNDPSVVARWTVDQVGSAPYDWYVSALPGAGFEIVGTYPSERAALIRLQESTGRTWQLLLELLGDQTRISLQTDRS